MDLRFWFFGAHTQERNCCPMVTLFNRLRNCQTIFYSDCPVPHFLQCERDSWWPQSFIEATGLEGEWRGGHTRLPIPSQCSQGRLFQFTLSPHCSPWEMGTLKKQGWP